MKRVTDPLPPPLLHPQTYSLRVSPVDNNMIAAGSFGGFIKVYNMSSGEELFLRGHTDRVYHIDWSSTDPLELCSGSRDKSARIWTLKTSSADGTGLYIDSDIKLDHPHIVNGVSYSPVDGNIIAFGYEDYDAYAPAAVWQIKRLSLSGWVDAVERLISVGNSALKREDLEYWGLPREIIES